MTWEQNKPWSPWKWTLRTPEDNQFRCSNHTTIIEMPKGAIITDVLQQRNTTVLYADVDPDAPKRLYRILLLGTGQVSDIPREKCRRLGTSMLTVPEKVLGQTEDNSVNHVYLIEETEPALVTGMGWPTPKTLDEIIQVNEIQYWHGEAVAA